MAVAQRDLATIARDAANDIHPPLYYWLLHGWVRLLGTGEAAVRSLSALLGVALVALIYALGRRLRPEGGAWIGLLAALLAAVNPFQVYYSQEARMYMLAAVLAAAAVLALIRFVESRSAAALVALVVLEAAGLYTHYSFVFVVVVVNLAYLLSLRTPRLDRGQVLGWIVAQAAVVLLYLPWLPTALRQVTSWPGPSPQDPFFQALADTWRWLVLGPTIETGQAAVPLLAATFLAVVGLFGWSRRHVWKPILLAVWLAVPVVSILALGLYREAYLKFLLVASPPVMLLLAAGTLGHGKRPTRYMLRFVQVIAILLVLAGAGVALRSYYVKSAYARDDYRGIAAYIQALGRPGDAILLNAPGQQEVFGYYYHGNLPVYPLPESRPARPGCHRGGAVRPGQPGRAGICRAVGHRRERPGAGRGGLAGPARPTRRWMPGTATSGWPSMPCPGRCPRRPIAAWTCCCAAPGRGTRSGWWATACRSAGWQPATLRRSPCSGRPSRRRHGVTSCLCTCWMPATRSWARSTPR